MTVEGKEKAARGVSVTPFDPLGRPPMAGEEHPGFGALEACLNVRHVTVRSLPAVTGQKGVDIRCLSSPHGGRCAGEFREDSRIVLLITDLIAHEHTTTLELPRRVSEREFGALFMAQLEDTSDVYLLRSR